MKKLLLLLALVTSIGMTCFTACNHDESSSSEPTSESSSSEELNESSSTQTATYTVTFKQDGCEDVVRTVNEGEALTDIPTPQAVTGYTVVWDVTDFSAIGENLVVNAVATVNTYTITYDLGTRAGDELAVLANTTQEVTYGEAYTLETASCEGYIFEGWTFNGEAIEDGTWDKAEDATLVAKWSEDPSSNRDHTGRY